MLFFIIQKYIFQCQLIIIIGNHSSTWHIIISIFYVVIKVKIKIIVDSFEQLQTDITTIKLKDIKNVSFLSDLPFENEDIVNCVNLLRNVGCL